MKVTSFTNASQKEGIKIFKPCTRLLVVQDFGTAGVTVAQASYKAPRCRIRLENSRTGQSIELVPNMKLETLSEIASHSEGFTRLAKADASSSNVVIKGVSYYSVVLNADAAIDLSADKYLEVDLYDLLPNASVTTEVFAIEGNTLDDFFCRYRKFNLSVGEAQKAFSVGDNEVLVLPFDGLSEIQFTTLTGDMSPTFTVRELRATMDLSNDICCVTSDAEGTQHEVVGNEMMKKDGAQTGFFGSCHVAVIALANYRSFEVRRDDGSKNYEFYMIDNKQ